ncbi:hypothetical protein [Halobacterium sp. KA-6]|uniref:hypothetical protein n=1 Tax=Halobacterium sp. KA-6 TaxID=2896368 RepID=UPI001E3B1E37|nr:hypothetical protein [Halobacterium sp. KA-6]MCD2204941.1 hypothetical protein [Halobacterium sp. KA-6]
MYKIRMRVAVATALVALTLTAGCIGGLSTDGSVDADAVGDAVEQRYAALDGYDATVTRTVDVGDSTTTARAAITVRGDQRQVTYTAGPNAGETVTSAADSGPVFETATSRTGAAAPAGYGALAETLVRTSNVSVDDVTSYEGHQTAVVALDATANETSTGATNVTRTVWVDLDRKIPLKVVTSWTTANGQPASVTVTYDNVTLHENNASNTAEVAA